jgi:3',5'-cyclic AMP phosphodiesterase CpdA
MSETESPTDTFIHIADLHFWKVVWNPLRLANKRILGMANVYFSRRRHFAMENAEPFADAVVATGVKDVLLTGDFTSTALDEEFAMAAAFVRGLANRGMRIALAPGNHDVYTFEARRKRRFERHFAEFLPEDGYPARVTLPGGTAMILAPTAVPNALSARGLIAPEAIERTLAMIAESPPGPVVVAAHYPLLPKTATYASTRQHRLRNAAQFRRRLGETGRHILYVAGHVHHASYVRDPKYPEIEYLTTGCLFRRDRHGEGEFSIVKVFTGEFDVTRRIHRGAWQDAPFA